MKGHKNVKAALRIDKDCKYAVTVFLPAVYITNEKAMLHKAIYVTMQTLS
jgi:hypothetical protein